MRTPSGAPAAVRAACRRAPITGQPSSISSPALQVVQTCSVTLIALARLCATGNGQTCRPTHRAKRQLVCGKHPVRRNSLCAGRSPGLRIQGCPNGCPPSRTLRPVASGDLSGHGRGGGSFGGCPLSHSLFACHRQEPAQPHLWQNPAPVSYTHLDVYKRQQDTFHPGQGLLHIGINRHRMLQRHQIGQAHCRQFPRSPVPSLSLIHI